MYFQKGGLVMWPLLACSITVIAIAIERFIYYKSVDSGAAFASRYCAAVAAVILLWRRSWRARAAVNARRCLPM